MTTTRIVAELVFTLEYEDEDLVGDPAATLLEILAQSPDRDLYDCITVTRVETE